MKSDGYCGAVAGQKDEKEKDKAAVEDTLIADPGVRESRNPFKSGG